MAQVTGQGPATSPLYTCRRVQSHVFEGACRSWEGPGPVTLLRSWVSTRGAQQGGRLQGAEGAWGGAPLAPSLPTARDETAAGGTRTALGLVLGSHMAASELPVPPPLALGPPFVRDLYCSQPDGFSCRAIPRVGAVPWVRVVPWVGCFRCIMAD